MLELSNLKSYTGTKTIKAMPLTKSEAEKLLGKTINSATPGEDGYLVEYPDGYRSWSPAKVFEDAYRISETHIDRMKIELADLSERICKASKAVNTFGLLPDDQRWTLSKQIEAMNKYADILYNRIRFAVKPPVFTDDGCCKPKLSTEPTQSHE